MSLGHQYALSRRGFCICCAVAAGFVRTGGWLSPSQAYAEAQNIVDLIRDDAAKAPSRSIGCAATSASSRGPAAISLS